MQPVRQPPIADGPIWESTSGKRRDACNRFCALLVLLALHDSFEVMVLPRRVVRRWRLARFFYRTGWRIWRRLCFALPPGRHRENALSAFGPLSLFGLFGTWALMLICGFALLHWGCQSLPADRARGFFQYVYFSGETFFTLGYGDFTPTTGAGMMLSVIEAGTGFGFMAVTIGYLPVLYQAFSSRERSIGLLDVRAGSPPTASEMLRRNRRADDSRAVERFLAEWEVWCAELLESHLSFPVLSYYHSQHDNQSWLAALALMLDASAVLLVTAGDSCRRRAELTFAMARHASVDLCLVFRLPPTAGGVDRLTTTERDQLIAPPLALGGVGVGEAAARLDELRSLYEPFLLALSRYFDLALPRFFPDRDHPDNWQTSAWGKRAPGITELTSNSDQPDQHFG